MSKYIFCFLLIGSLPCLAQESGTWNYKVALGGADLTEGWHNPDLQPALQLGMVQKKDQRLVTFDLFYTNPDDSGSGQITLDDVVKNTTYEYEVEQLSLMAGYGLEIEKVHFLGRVGLSSLKESIETKLDSASYQAEVKNFGLEIGIEIGYRVFGKLDLSLRVDRYLSGNSKTEQNDPNNDYDHNNLSAICFMVGYRF